MEQRVTRLHVHMIGKLHASPLAIAVSFSARACARTCCCGHGAHVRTEERKQQGPGADWRPKLLKEEPAPGSASRSAAGAAVLNTKGLGLGSSVLLVALAPLSAGSCSLAARLRACRGWCLVPVCACQRTCNGARPRMRLLRVKMRVVPAICGADV